MRAGGGSVTRRVTSADVAVAAGVSRATVSYVLNNRADKQVTAETRSAVLTAAEQLGYQPSPAARALRSGRGDIVLVLLPDWDTAGETGRLLATTGRLLAGRNLPCLRYEGAQWQGRLRHLLTAVTAAAVVTFQPLSRADATAVENAGIPELRAWLLDQPGHPHTTRIDQADIVRAQVEHLLVREYRQLVYAAAIDPPNQGFVDARVAAFHQMCGERELQSAKVTVLPADPAQAAPMVRRWTRSRAPIGVCAYNDVVAMNVLAAARTHGLRVPVDLGVVGTDDNPAGAYCDPPLTTVRFDLTQEATQIAQSVFLALGLDGEMPAEPAANPIQIVHRAST
jgi:DNA-binding LacI/PurR family transcriptional regulator